MKKKIRVKGLVFTDEDKKDSNITQLKKKNNYSVSKRIAIVTCAVIIIIAVAFNWDSLSPAAMVDTIQNFTGGLGQNKYPVTYSQGIFKDAVAMGNDIGVLTDTTFLIYSQTGNQLAERQHGLGNPQIAASGNKAVIYDGGGTQLRIETRLSEAFSMTADYPIITAAINSLGYFAFSTSSSDYLSEMTVYNSNFEKIFKFYSAQGRIISLALNSDGSRVAVLTLEAENGDIKSSISVYDTGSKEQKAVWTKSFDGIFLFSVQYRNNSIIAVGDSETAVFDSGGKEINTYSYSDKTLKCYYNGTDNTVFVFSRYGIGKESTVVTLDSTGKPKGQQNADEEIKDLNADGNYIAVLVAGGMKYYSADFKNTGSMPASGDIIKLLCIKNYVYIFGPDAVYQYNIK